MHFEALEKFEWLNDPENVRFDDDTMVVYAKEKTDFWQSIHHGFSKDDGHFFFCREENDFVLTVHWQFDNLEQFSQCGLMVRADERNWFKVSVMKDIMEKRELISSLTVNGHSDWCGFALNGDISQIWFRIQRVDDDYILFYSFDGVVYTRLRMFYLQNYEEIKVGAYIANPSEKEFSAKLSGIKFGV